MRCIAAALCLVSLVGCSSEGSDENAGHATGGDNGSSGGGNAAPGSGASADPSGGSSRGGSADRGAPDGSVDACTTDSECDGGQCVDGKCVAPARVSGSIDGKAFEVTSMQLLNAGPHVLFVDVSEPGASAARMAITAARTGSGCDTPAAEGIANYVRYDVDFSSAFQSDGGPSCGLTVASLPNAIGERFTGSFFGTIPSANAQDPTTRQIKITFDVPRLD